jgi:gliding motility-associated-like protein
MRKFLILLFLSLCALSTYAQTVSWDRTYGSNWFDASYSIAITGDGGYVIAGNTTGVGGDVSEPTRDVNDIHQGDYWVVRTDSMGLKIWDRRFGGDSADYCLKVLPNQFGFLLVGFSRSNISGDKTAPKKGMTDVWVVQIRPDGSKIWDKSYGGVGTDEAFNAIATDDGGYLILAHSDSPAGGDKTEDGRGLLDMWVIKIRADGTKVWDKTYGGTSNDEYPTGLAKMTDGNFLIGCGTTSDRSIDKSESAYGIKDMWVLKIDKTDGHILWDKTYGGSDVDELNNIQPTPDGNYLVGGQSISGISGNKRSGNYGNRDYWILKITPTGDIIWDKSYGGSNNDNLTSMYQNETGYTLIGGISSSIASGNKTDSLKGGNDFWFCYLDRDGNKVWDKSVGGAGNDTPQAWVRTPDRGYVICGHSDSNRGGDKSEDVRLPPQGTTFTPNDFWIVKIKCVFDLNIGPDTANCARRDFVLNATLPNCPNCIYSWSTGSAEPIITVNPDTTTTYRVRVIATDACLVVDDIKLTVIPSPKVATYKVTLPKCHDGNDGVIALDSAKGGTAPYYLIVKSQTKSDTLRGQIFATNKSPGTYRISLVDKNNCSLDKDVIVRNPELFQIRLPDDIQIQLGDSFRLLARTNHKLDTFWWSDKTIKKLDTILHPLESTNYTFNAVDSLGCRQSAVMQVIVQKKQYSYAPTVFSPNGDGRNDYFIIYGSPTVKSIDNMQVYDRWGDLIYMSPHVYPARDDAGWDGRARGKDAPPAVYIYTAIVTYLDGRQETIQGDVLLMR